MALPTDRLVSTGDPVAKEQRAHETGHGVGHGRLSRQVIDQISRKRDRQDSDQADFGAGFT